MQTYNKNRMRAHARALFFFCALSLYIYMKKHLEGNKNSTDVLEDQFKKLFWKAEQKN